MTVEDRTISSADGLALYVRDYAPRAPEKGLPVVCLHGLTRNSADFEDVAPRIAAMGRRVIVPDMRGRGHSQYDSQPARYQPAIYARDVLTILDFLGVARAVFLGTSMGGIITMLVAASAPQRIAAAILNDIGPVLDPRGLARIGGYVGKAGDFASFEDVAAQVRVTQGAAFPDADAAFWLAFARRVAKALPGGRVGFAYDPAIGDAFAKPSDAPPPDLSPYFAALAQKPVLLLRGALSDLLAADGVETMRRIKPDLVSVEVARVGHAPTLDEGVAVAAIEDFLRSVP